MRAFVFEPDTARSRTARPSMLASFAVHTGFVLLAALGTQTPPPMPIAVRDTTIFLPADPQPSRPASPGQILPGLPRVPRPVAFQLPSTFPLPDLVPPGVMTTPGAIEAWPGNSGITRDTAAGPGGGSPVVDQRVVEDPPLLVSHPIARYPEILRQAGIEGSVVVEAVLDTLGRVEAGSLRVARGAHPLFEAEALSVVRASQYRPGRMGAHAVRVRIQVPVHFALRP